MSAGSGDFEKAESVAREIGERAASDRDYAKQLYDDPVGTLLAAGMPPVAVADVLRESGVDDDEVQGYVLQISQRTGLGAPSLTPSLGGKTGGLADCTITVISGACCISSITSIASTGSPSTSLR